MLSTHHGIYPPHFRLGHYVSPIFKTHFYRVELLDGSHAINSLNYAEPPEKV